MAIIYDKLSDWFLQLGLSEELSMILLRVVAIVGLLVVSAIIDLICRKLIVPIVRKITVRTESKWDDYLLNDAMLNDICRLIVPVAAYALIPLFLQVVRVQILQ